MRGGTMMNEPKRMSGPAWPFIIASMAVSTVYWLSHHRGLGHDWGDDFGLYIQSAINISAGVPAASMTTGVSIPPGLPLVIIATSPLHGWNIVSMKLIGTVSIGLIGILAFFLARQRVRSLASLGISAACMWNAWEFVLNQSVGADLPFTAASIACILAACIALSPERLSPRSRSISLILAPVFMLIAMLVKPAGLALAPALVVALMFAVARTNERATRDRYVLATLAVLLAVVGYYTFASESSVGFTQQASGYLRSYSNPIEAVIGLIELGIPRELTNMRLLLFWFGGSAVLTAIVLVCAISAWGANLVLRRGVAPLEWYASSHIAMIVLTPWSDGGVRYLLPALPLIYILFASFLEQVVDFGNEWLRQHANLSWAAQSENLRSFIAAMPLIVIALQSAQLTYGIRNRDDNEINRPVVGEFVDWLKQNSKPNDTLCSFKPRAVMYLTQRKTCYVGSWQKSQSAAEFIKSQKAQYLVLMIRPENNPDPGLPDRIRSDPSLCVRFANSEYAVYGSCDVTK
jgi:hypothetical protein